MHYLDPLYKIYHIKNSSGVTWGHRGQKVIFTKKASSPTKCVALMRDSCICISLTPSTKVITLKNYPGSLGVTGVKRSFSPKKASSPTKCVALMRDSCICISLTPSTNVITLKKIVRDHLGSQVIFTKNALTRPFCTG